MQTVPLKMCSYVKKDKSLRLASEFFAGQFPSEFKVHSHHTGKTVVFRQVQPDDALYSPGWWGGEMMVYRPLDKTPNVDHMVVVHEW